MTRFPKIDSPCPLIADRENVFVDDYCTHCERQVHDLTTMSSVQREQFLNSCDQEICVSYRLSTKIPMRKSLQAVFITAAISATAGSMTVANAQEPFCELEEIVVVGGGVKDPSKAEWIDVEDDNNLPDLPVVIETVDSGEGST